MFYKMRKGRKSIQNPFYEFVFGKWAGQKNSVQRPQPS